MHTTRRQFMRGAAALGLLPVTRYVVGCGDGSGASGPDDGLPVYRHSGSTGPESLFEHGVASGDPLTDAVILWTRVSPESEGEVEVFFEVAMDADFAERIAAGTETTSAEQDYTVKLDLAGLEPGTTYYYRFKAQGRESIVGRTRTAPDGDVGHLRFAVMSCSNYAFGYFHGYRHAAERADLDAVVHLGDYIYEYESGGYGSFRDLEPAHEIVKLEDYRMRYSQYRRDPDLQAVHQQHPFIAVWDDHELANDAWRAGAMLHMNDEDGDFDERRMVAARAYAEWLPIRDITDGRIYRKMPYGDLVDLVMLDTRLWGRDLQSTDADVQNEEARTLLGEDQEQWVAEQLKASKATWCLIGQQVVMSQLQLTQGATLNPDGWDGYTAARMRFYDAIRDSGRDNVVVLTGDIHASAAADLVDEAFDTDAYDPETGEGAVAVELVTPGVTSPFALPGLEQDVVAASPPMHWADGTNRGYMVIDVTAERLQADWYHYPDPELQDVEPEFNKAYSVQSGVSHVVEESDAVADAADAPALAPTE